MKYLILLVLCISLLGCQSGSTTHNHQKEESPSLNSTVKANQSTPTNERLRNKPATLEPELKTIVFVCTYGFDKSVIAANYFNDVMSNKRLNYKAISRAALANQRKTNNIPTAILLDILSTGLTLRSSDVTLLSEMEINSADKIICLDKPPATLKDNQPLIFWEAIPPLKADADKTTAIIKEKVDNLVKEIGC